MATLSQRQLDDVRFAASIASRLSFSNSILFVGEKGVGKRTIARGIAAELNLEFIEFSLRGSPQQIVNGLFGAGSAAKSATESLQPPGELGASESTLLYLSGLQCLPLELAHPLYQVLRTGRYTDQLGSEWRLSPKLVIVGGFTMHDDDRTISDDSFVCTGFGHRVVITPPLHDADLATIADAIWAEYLPDSSRDIRSRLLFQFVRVAHDTLYSLRRWIAALAKMSLRGQTPSTSEVTLLPSLDLHYLAAGIEYRGKRIEIDALQRWFSQFPRDLRPLAWTLIRHVAISYYVNRDKYFRALQTCIDGSGISPGTNVCFCKSQALGRSEPRVTNELKNLGHWKTDAELDLTLTKPNWERVAHYRWFVLADDFVGSGNTLRKAIQGSIKVLLDALPTAEVRILVAVGFREAIQSCIDELHPWRNRVKIVPGLLFDDRDRCFSTESRILRSSVHRERLKKFCAEIARQQFPGLWRKGFHLGWQEMATLVVFSDTVPNNTLPIIWFRSSSWRPIFPASGLLE